MRMGENEPLTALLAVALALAVVAVVWSNGRLMGGYASSNRDATLIGQTRQQELMAELIKQQAALGLLSDRMVQVQEIFASYSNEAIKSRRFQGAQEKLRSAYCLSGAIRGKLCENLLDPSVLDMLTK